MYERCRGNCASIGVYTCVGRTKRDWTPLKEVLGSPVTEMSDSCGTDGGGGEGGGGEGGGGDGGGEGGGGSDGDSAGQAGCEESASQQLVHQKGGLGQSCSSNQSHQREPP